MKGDPSLQRKCGYNIVTQTPAGIRKESLILKMIINGNHL